LPKRLGRKTLKRVKELEDEVRRLKRIYAEERIKAESPSKPLRESCKAIS
jgi:hypothetical protein